VVAGAGGERTVMVESNGTPAFDYDKASVRVGPDTRVLRATGTSTYAIASAEDLVTGATVDVWFEGAVAESYPVQASAGTVVIGE
jgi:hypothetical protein